MKKLFSLILALSLFLSAFALADYDVTAMTDQELQDLIAACSAELRARNTSEPDGILIANEGGFRIYQTGEAYIDKYGRLKVPVLVYNDLDVVVSVTPHDVTCNDYNCIGYFYGNLQPKSKKKAEMDFATESVGLTSVDEIYSLLIRWYIWSSEDKSIDYESPERLEYRFW